MRKYLLLIAALLVLFASQLFAVSAPQLYNAQFSVPGVLAWAPTANGNTAPTVNISGGAVAMTGPSGCAVDSSGNLWVADFNTNRIYKWNAGVTGNLAPNITITPPGTHVRWLNFDSNGYLYVVDQPALSVYIYSPAQLAATGSPVPNKLTGALTTFGSIAAVALGPDNKIYVTDDAESPLGQTIDIFAASTAGGNVAPTGQIVGSNTGFGPSGTDFLEGVTVDSTSNVYAVVVELNEVFEFNAGSTGNVAPNKTIVGAGTGLNHPRGIVVDASGNVYVANNSGNSITVYSSGQSGNATPIQTISGGNTLINSGYELALWPVAGVTTGKGFFFAP